MTRRMHHRMEGHAKPACVAELVSRAYSQATPRLFVWRGFASQLRQVVGGQPTPLAGHEHRIVHEPTHLCAMQRLHAVNGRDHGFTW